MSTIIVGYFVDFHDFVVWEFWESFLDFDDVFDITFGGLGN